MNRRWWRRHRGIRWTAAVLTVLVVSAACTDSTSKAADSEVDAGVAAGIALQMGSLEDYRSVRAILVLAEGRTVFERYYDSSPSEYWDVASVTKSVVSTLVGIAVGEGRLRLDEPLSQLLPAYASVMKPEVARATLQQVLTMTAGFSGQFGAEDFAFTETQDWARGVLQGPAQPPGESFSYSNGGSHLLSAILVERTGQSVLDFARAKLFDPLGIATRPAFEALPFPDNFDAYQKAGFAWPVDPQRRHTSWGLLKLRPADMAKIGTLYLNGGRWEGKQILPQAWVRDATTAHVTTGDVAEGYGYQWWVTTAAGDPAYFAWGFGGQLIEVVPRRHLVVVVSTEYNPEDLNSRGVEPTLLTYMVDSVIAPVLPP